MNSKLISVVEHGAIIVLVVFVIVVAVGVCTI
jgi:hypothetical protein